MRGGIHHVALKVREGLQIMPLPSLNPRDGRARVVSAKLPDNDAEWIDALVERSGAAASVVLRRVIKLAQKHEEELLEVS